MKGRMYANHRRSQCPILGLRNCGCPASYVVVLAWMMAWTCAGGMAVADDRPDILMIAVDDLRPMLGCYGDSRIRTPNIDRLARRALLFERAYCQYAKCGTSRLSVMTGLRPDAIGVFSNRDRDVAAFRQRRPDAVSMPRWFKDHGYHTRSFGKIDHDGWQLMSDWSLPPEPGRPQEMLEVVDARQPHQPTVIAERLACPVMQSPDVPDEHLFAGRMTAQVLQVMRAADRRSRKPVFLAVGYRRPHLPFVAPQRYFDKYQPNRSWLAANPQPAKESPIMAWFNSDGYVGTARRVGLTMPNPPDRMQAVRWNGYEMRSYLGVPNQGPIPESLQLELLRAYAACVSYVDAQIGLLLDELDRTRRWDNTLVLLWSDHGWHLGEHSAWGKMTNFEIATRVPLLIAGRGIRRGRTRAVSELVDLYPTLCELSGLPTPKHIAGSSLVSVLRKPGPSGTDVAFSQYARFGTRYMGRALRTDRFRFVMWMETKTGQVLHRELYDHRVDAHEQHNVARQPRYARQLEHLELQLGQAGR